MNARRLAVLAGFSVAALATSGCGAGGSPADGNAPNAGGGLLVPDAVTIATLFGIPDVPSPEVSREQELLVESLIAECMAEQGWEYIPVVLPDEVYGYPVEDELVRRQREGYDMAYYVLTHSSAETIVDPWAGWVDPNAAYLDGLSPDAWEAYHAALDGDVWVQTDTYSGMTGGCITQANDEVSPALPETDLFANEFGYEIGEIKVRVDEVFDLHVHGDPRVLELEATWSACMRDAGYDFDTNADLWAYVWGSGFQARLDAILGDDFYLNPDIVPGSGVVPVTDEERAALEDLLADEVAMAIAALPCDVAYQAAYEEVYAVIEAEFVDDQRDEIEAAIEKAIRDGLRWDWVVTDGYV